LETWKHYWLSWKLGEINGCLGNLENYWLPWKLGEIIGCLAFEIEKLLVALETWRNYWLPWKLGKLLVTLPLKLKNYWLPLKLKNYWLPWKLEKLLVALEIKKNIKISPVHCRAEFAPSAAHGHSSTVGWEGGGSVYAAASAPVRCRYGITNLSQCLQTTVLFSLMWRNGQSVPFVHDPSM
jgi:hypothetical protein